MTEAVPWRKVLQCFYVGESLPRGCIPGTSQYTLTLICGHEQFRTEHNAHVKKARCRKCAETTCVHGREISQENENEPGGFNILCGHCGGKIEWDA